MTQTTTTTQNLAAVVHASEAAAEAAAKAQQVAQLAQTKADEARERAEAERDAANRRYLDVLATEHETARSDALTAQADSRQALETAVLSGGDAFAAYAAYVRASVAVWQVSSALAEQRHYHGLPVRSADPPIFSFQHDIALIIDTYALETLDDAIQANRDRRAAFLSGAVS